MPRIRPLPDSKTALRGCAALVFALSLCAPLAAAQDPAPPWVIGHRGGTVLRPENTLLTYDYSLSNGVTGVEFDVWLSADGFPVCHHDPTLDRTTNGTGPIVDKTLAELLTLDAGFWFGSGQYTGTPIPRFEEGLQAVEGRGKLLLDIKAIAYVPTLVTAIENEGFPKNDVWVWNRFGTGQPFKDLMPEAHVVSSGAAALDREEHIYDRMQLGEDGVVASLDYIDPRYVDLAHSYGALFMSHTVVSPRFQEQIDLGVDILVASHPTLFAAQYPTTSDPECADGIDNDGDGLVDFPDDPSCWGAADDHELAACSDGIDNDGDGATDYPNDPGCYAAFYPLEDPECSDGVDNNRDGAIDFPADAGCFAAFDQGEARACANGIDDDGDGLIDYPDDPGCLTVSSVSESPECDDGYDNDGDGLTDEAGDPGCHGASDISESSALHPACDDGVDNDGDGLVDHPDDPDCLGPNDDTEAVECSDGLDNDGDGLTDLDDPHCRSATDPTEQRECINGLDDDGDGSIDFPADAQCAGVASDAESATSVGPPLFGPGTAFLVAALLLGATSQLGRRPRVRPGPTRQHPS